MNSTLCSRFAPLARPRRAYSASPLWRFGFDGGASFFKDAAKTIPALADGDLIYTAADPIGGADLVQATAGQRPILDLFTFSQPSVQFQSWRSTNLNRVSTPSVNSQSFTLIASVAYLGLTSQTGTPTWLYFGSGIDNRSLLATVLTLPLPVWEFYGTGPGANYSSPFVPISYGKHIITIIGTPSAWTVRLDGAVFCVTAPINAGSLSGMMLGALAGVYNAHVAVAGVKLYGSPLSGANLTAAEAAASAYANVGTTFDASKPCFLFAGDSLTSTSAASDELHLWPLQMFTSLTNGTTYRRSSANLAVPGTTIVNWQTAGSGSLVDSYYNASRPKNVLSFWAGRNDSTDATGTYNDFKAFCAARKATGWTIVAIDMLPSDPSGADEPRRDGFNTSLAGDFTTTLATNIKKGGAAYADYLIRLSGDTTIGLDGCNLNTTYYASDKLHLLDAGLAIVAGYAKTVMNDMGYT